MSFNNGEGPKGNLMRGHFERIEGQLDDIRDDLASAIKELTSAVNRLCDKMQILEKMWQGAVPLKVVGWMFAILVLALAGVQGVQYIFKVVP